MTNIPETVRRLRRLDCCAISDALDKLGLGGVVSGVQQAAGDKRVAGRIVTVKLGTGAPAAGEPRHLGSTAIELAGPDDVIVIEQHTGIEAGSWGGLLSLGAKVKDIAGVIADGPVRDIDEAREMQFPVFANAFTARTARGRIVEKGTNVAIEAFGVAVAPGDFVVADRSAVIFIRSADVDRVLAAAEAIVAREARMAKAVLARTPMSQVMGGNYEFMLKD